MSLHSQDEDNEKFFKKENVFTGGTLNAVFGNQIISSRIIEVAFAYFQGICEYFEL